MPASKSDQDQVSQALFRRDGKRKHQNHDAHGELTAGQHGIPRAEGRGEQSAEARAKELKEINQYKRLVDEIDIKVSLCSVVAVV